MSQRMIIEIQNDTARLFQTFATRPAQFVGALPVAAFREAYQPLVPDLELPRLIHATDEHTTNRILAALDACRKYPEVRETFMELSSGKANS